MSETFHCARCGCDKPIQKHGGTGYAERRDGTRICYVCAGQLDSIDMVATGKATLYLTTPECARGRDAEPRVTQWGKISNWPGTLEFKFHKSAMRTGRHNIAGKRYDVWFTGPDGKTWHGVTYGDNTQLCQAHQSLAFPPCAT